MGRLIGETGNEPLFPENGIIAGQLPASSDPGVRARARRTAETLMRLALPLLDVAGQSMAAARLQHAVDSLDPNGG